MLTLDEAEKIADREFGDVVTTCVRIGHKTRSHLKDGSFVDLYLSSVIPGRFGIHWERRQTNAGILRYDNTPNTKWKDVRGFPFHVHRSKYANVVPSEFSEDIKLAFREFMGVARNEISKH